MLIDYLSAIRLAVGVAVGLTPYAFWARTTDPGNFSELSRADMRGVMLSKALATNRMGWLVLPPKGPVGQYQNVMQDFPLLMANISPPNRNLGLIVRPIQPIL